MRYDHFDDLPDWLTVQQMARYLRIGRNQAYEQVASGKIPSVRFGRTIRVSKWALARGLGLEPFVATQLEDDEPFEMREFA